MATYEDSMTSTTKTPAWMTPNKPVEVMATPNVVPALQGLADAAHLLAKCSEAFIYARNDLANAQATYNEALNAVVAEREKAGV